MPSTHAHAQELINIVQNTDRGLDATPQQRARVLALAQTLENSFATADVFAPPAAPLLLRRAEVAFVGQSSSVKANAAGGRYRGRVGRLLFRTDALFQHLLDGGVAVNVIQFRLLGLLPGSAILKGDWKRAEPQQFPTLRGNSSRALSANTAVVEFEAPRLALGRTGWLTLRLGPSSRVGLDCTYVDDRLRICRGASSGTLFVFRYDTCAPGGPLEPRSREWEAIVARQPLSGASVGRGLLLGAAAVAGLTRRLAHPLAFAAAAAAVLLLRSTGGIVVSRDGNVPPAAGAGEPSAQS